VEQLMRKIASSGLDPQQFLAPRRCQREPIPEIFHAAHLLDRAVGAHLAGQRDVACALIRQADLAVIRDFTEMLWGGAVKNPEQWRYIRKRPVPGTPEGIDEDLRHKPRDPSVADKRIIVARDGHHCMFCGMPVIRKEVRKAITKAYPEAKVWDDNTNETQHAAFQCMWLQYDHVFPHAKGGDNSPGNVVVACAPCNYGRRELTLDEIGVIDPRNFPVLRTSWDGLERFMSAQ
jgi:5-methylcytosine-specific restriction endonuclease McrA